MCDIQAFSTAIQKEIEQVNVIAQEGMKQVKEGIDFLCGRSVQLLISSANVTARIFKSPAVCKDALSGFVNIVNATHLFNRIIVSKKAIDTVNTIQDFISAIRVIESLDYVVTGKFVKDYAKGLYFKIAAEVCFLFARIGDTAIWAAKQQLLVLGSLASATATISIFGIAAIQVTMETPILVLAIAGMVGFACEDIRVLFRGEEIAYRLMDLANIAIGCAFVSMLIIGGFPPLLLAALGVASAGTAIASFILEP